MRAPVRSAATLVALFLSTLAFGQSGVTVELDDITDNRVSAGGFAGSLEMRVKLTGSPLDKAEGARIVVKEARDDRNNVLIREDADPPDFTPRDYNSGTLQFSLQPPARAASSVKIKGTVELFVPSRDPSAIVKIAKALDKLDTPLSSKTLKAAKIEITPLSKAGYATAMKARKIDDKAIEAIRAEGKKRGVSDKEIDEAIGFAKALEGLDADAPDGAVFLSGMKSDFDRIFRIEILDAEGKPVSVGSRTTSSRGDQSIMTLQPNQPVPAGATLQLALLSNKSRVAFPFELSVPLP